LIAKGKQSGLQTRIATESVSLCAQMKSSLRFLEFESAICACGTISRHASPRGGFLFHLCEVLAVFELERRMVQVCSGDSVSWGHRSALA
jgi:hypothetical protein